MSRENLRKNLISFVVLFQVLGLLAFTLPKYEWLRPLAQPLRNTISPYVMYSGLWQNWSMFAPNPRINDVQFTAVAIMKNKTERIWSIPNPHNTGFFERYQIDRYRKWANDHLRSEQDDDVCREAARYIRSQLNEPDNPVETLDFRYASKTVSIDESAEGEWIENGFYHDGPHSP